MYFIRKKKKRKKRKKIEGMLLTIHGHVVNLVFRLCIAQFADFVKSRLTEADIHQDQCYTLFTSYQRDARNQARDFTDLIMTS